MTFLFDVVGGSTLDHCVTESGGSKVKLASATAHVGFAGSTRSAAGPQNKNTSLPASQHFLRSSEIYVVQRTTFIHTVEDGVRHAFDI